MLGKWNDGKKLKGIDFLSQGVVKSNFREKPAMFRLRIPGLAWLMGVKVK